MFYFSPTFIGTEESSAIAISMLSDCMGCCDLETLGNGPTSQRWEREIAIEGENYLKTARDGERESNCLETGAVAGF